MTRALHRRLTQKGQLESCPFYPNRMPRSVSYGASGTQPGLRANELREEPRTLVACTTALVGDREEPDANEGSANREQRRVGVREDRLGVTQYLHPYCRAENGQNQRGEQADGTTKQRSAGSQVLPVHGKEQHREVTAGGDGEGQAHHEGNVLLLESDAQQDRDHTQRESGDLGHAHLVGFLGLALLDHAGIQVMGYRRSASQRQAGNYRQDSGEGDCRNEAQEQDRKSTRLNSSHVKISYAVFCLKKKRERR